jgi:hypothetical protein
LLYRTYAWNNAPVRGFFLMGELLSSDHQFQQLEDVNNNNAPAQGPAPEHHRLTPGKILVIILVVIIIFGLSMPETSSGESLVGFGIFCFGLYISGMFLRTELRRSRLAKNVFLRVFIVIGGIGISLVLICVTIVAAFISALATNPDSLQCG